MVKKKRRVVWDDVAKNDLRHICEYIRRASSVTVANKVKKTLIETSKLLKDNPEMFAADPFFGNTNDNIRSYTKWHYRVTYQVLDELVVIIKVAHTSQNPDDITE